MGLNQSICQQQSQPQAYQWCTFQDNDYYTNIVEICFLVSLILVTLMIVKSYWKMIEYRRSRLYRKYFGWFYVYVYRLVMVWITVTFLRCVFGIVVYYVYMSQDFVDDGRRQSTYQEIFAQQQPTISSPIVIYSVIFTLITFITSYVINLLMFIIPYKWLNTLLFSINDNQQLNLQCRKKVEQYFKIMNFMRFYFKYFRVLYLVLLFVQPFLFFFTDILRCKTSKYNHLYVVIQTNLILFFYIFGYFVLKYLRNNGLIQLTSDHMKIIAIQYFLLIIVLLTRIFLNYYFRVLDNYPYVPNCNCSDTYEQDWLQATVYIVLHHYIMHMLGIVIVVFVYRPSVEKRRKDQEILKVQGAGNFLESLRTQSGDVSVGIKDSVDSRSEV